MRSYLKILREQNKFTQQEISKRLKCSRQSYGTIENGSRQKSLKSETIFKLAEVFDVLPSYILEQEQKFKLTG